MTILHAWALGLMIGGALVLVAGAIVDRRLWRSWADENDD